LTIDRINPDVKLASNILRYTRDDETIDLIAKYMNIHGKYNRLAEECDHLLEQIRILQARKPATEEA
jgi:hypothetical protein